MKIKIAALLIALSWTAPAPALLWPSHPDTYGTDGPVRIAAAGQGNWSFESQAGAFMWTGTRTDHGSLGQFCNVNAGACAWILTLRGAACAAGERYPVLVNTERAASHHLLQCMGGAGDAGAAFAFTDFDTIDFAVRHGQQIGIAIPEQDDAIGVARFALAGAAAAVDQMRAELTQEIALAPPDGGDSQ